jgi:hypothetical protein
MAAAWIAGIGAVSSIVGGIFGSSQASEANATNQANYEAQKKAAAEQAAKTNEYNKKVFEAEKANYEAQAAYEWQTAIKNWQYNQEIQDFQYLQTAKQYLSSVENTEQQLTYNSVAAQQAQAQEQASFLEIMNQAAFQQEGLIIESLQKEGKAALMQAGASRAKAIQSTVAEQGRNAAILSASLLSAGQQSQKNLQDIELGKYADDLKAKAAMMIQPEQLPNLPTPIKPPTPIFVEPMEATAGYIPSPIKQNIFAPIVSGIAGAAGAVMQGYDPASNKLFGKNL